MRILISSYTRFACVVYSVEFNGEVGTRSDMCCVGWVVWVLVPEQKVRIIWNISIDIKSFRSHYGPGVDSASERNEYREYFLGVKAAVA